MGKMKEKMEETTKMKLANVEIVQNRNIEPINIIGRFK